MSTNRHIVTTHILALLMSCTSRVTTMDKNKTQISEHVSSCCFLKLCLHYMYDHLSVSLKINVANYIYIYIYKSLGPFFIKIYTLHMH